MSFKMTLSGPDGVNKIFNDTKRRGIFECNVIYKSD